MLILARADKAGVGIDKNAVKWNKTIDSTDSDNMDDK